MKITSAVRFISFFLAIFVSFNAIAAANPADILGIIQAGQFTPPPNQLGKSGFIELVHQRQEKNLCVPTSASIVLQHFGQLRTPRELKVLSRRQRYDPKKRFNDFTLTMFDDLIAGIYTLDINWRQQNYPNTKAGAMNGLEHIRNAIDQGAPVLIDTTLYGGHTIIVSGYDDTAQNLVIIDPNIDAPGLRIISYKKIEEIWNSRGVGYNGRGAIFTSPKR
jgi:uncharacterized protein YvpB